MGEISLNASLFSVAPEEKVENKSGFEIKKPDNEAYYSRNTLKRSLKIKSGTITSKHLLLYNLISLLNHFLLFLVKYILYQISAKKRLLLLIPVSVLFSITKGLLEKEVKASGGSLN